MDWSSRLIRPGKTNLSAAVPDILSRPEINVDCWKETLQQLLGPNKKIDGYFRGSPWFERRGSFTKMLNIEKGGSAT